MSKTLLQGQAAQPNKVGGKFALFKTARCINSNEFVAITAVHPSGTRTYFTVRSIGGLNYTVQLEDLTDFCL